MSVNLKNITTALETMLRLGLSGYTIQRNAERNEDPNVAMQAGSGWIGIYRGSVSYIPQFCGMANIHKAAIEIDVEIQVASMTSGDDAEDRLENAVAAVMGVLSASPEARKIGNTVDHVTGYDVAYEYNRQNEIWFHAAIVTIKSEVNGV